MTKPFIFKQTNQDNWSKIRDEFNTTLNKIFCKISFGEIKDDFEIEIRKICKKRSGQQLKGYWVLICKVTKWMNEEGKKKNKQWIPLIKEQVSDWFIIKAGFYVSMGQEKMARSIANKSDCTVEQMEAIIHEVIEFGARNNIKDCYIEPRDLQDLLNNFR